MQLLTFFLIPLGVVAQHEQLQLSVARLKVLWRPWDWFAESNHHLLRESHGTAVLVTSSELLHGAKLINAPAAQGPFFLTTASTVQVAQHISLGLPVLGTKTWQVEVESMCHHFDLAVLRPVDGDSFKKALVAAGVELQPLSLAMPGPLSLGTEALLLGFVRDDAGLEVIPSVLGGEVTSFAAGGLCVQHGASVNGKGGVGWPILSLYPKKLLGLHSGGDDGCMIPAWRIRAFLHSAGKDITVPPIVLKPSQTMLRVPDSGLTTVPGNEAVYHLFRGKGKERACPAQGILVTRIAGNSLFRSAEPELSSPFLLLKVRGIPLDSSGLGAPPPTYNDEPVPFSELLWMQEDLSGQVEVVTCTSNGYTQKHSVSLSWQNTYGNGIRWVSEPYLEGVESERIGDISLMQMTKNHVYEKMQHIAMVARWLHPDLVDTPRVVVNWVRPGSYASRVGFQPGACISELNGHPVYSLSDVRKFFVPDGLVQQGPSRLTRFGASNSSGLGPDAEEVAWSIRTDLGKIYTDFFLKLLREAMLGPSPTPAVRDAAKRLSKHFHHIEANRTVL